MATTDSDAPLPPAEAVAVFDRFKANLVRVAATNKERIERLEASNARAQDRKVKPEPAT
jgi:hypothetical protein